MIKWAVPAQLDAANDELEPLPVELAAMVPRWATVRTPLIVIHGDKDGLVPPAHHTFWAQHA
ncbi:MAG: hypothetical protein J6386_18985 [Candidatus Synoicihabitans palmerolidicus]|nr:hypothetical protein [Candidatus Synoicihabitans palmerolidicus]